MQYHWCHFSLINASDILSFCSYIISVHVWYLGIIMIILLSLATKKCIILSLALVKSGPKCRKKGRPLFVAPFLNLRACCPAKRSSYAKNSWRPVCSLLFRGTSDLCYCHGGGSYHNPSTSYHQLHPSLA